MTRSTGQRHRWSPDEIEQALSLAGDVPWPLVPLLYNRWAKAHGRPRRTEPALRLDSKKSLASCWWGNSCISFPRFKLFASYTICAKVQFLFNDRNVKPLNP